jgi:hypothetical protein
MDELELLGDSDGRGEVLAHDLVGSGEISNSPGRPETGAPNTEWPDMYWATFSGR